MSTFYIIRGPQLYRAHSSQEKTSGLRSVTAILHIFGNNERTDELNMLSFGVRYDFVAQKWRILEFSGNYLEGIGI